MLHFWPRSLENPSEIQLDILQQVTGNLDMSNVSRMVLGSDIIVLQDPSRIEVMHKSLGLEVVVHCFNLFEEPRSLFPSIPDLAETTPERLPVDQLYWSETPEGTTYEDDDLRVWPCLVHTVDQVNVSTVELRRRNVVCCVIVISSNVDHRQIRRWMSSEFPRLRIVAPDLNGSAAGVRGLIPLIFLSVKVAITLLVVQADPWIRLFFSSDSASILRNIILTVIENSLCPIPSQKPHDQDAIPSYVAYWPALKLSPMISIVLG